MDADGRIKGRRDDIGVSVFFTLKLALFFLPDSMLFSSWIESVWFVHLKKAREYPIVTRGYLESYFLFSLFSGWLFARVGLLSVSVLREGRLL